jgi:hypothetical protein
VDGGESQRTFVYIKDAIEAVLLMIVGFVILCSSETYYCYVRSTEGYMTCLLTGKSCQSQWPHL